MDPFSIGILGTIFSFILGLIIGSFLNVVIFRYNTGRGVGGRSMCLSCVRKLSWFELIPVFSYLSTGGRCRQCLSKISVQYPLVEIATALLFASVWITQVDPVMVLYGWIAFPLLMVISVYDLRHMIIPDGVVATLIVLGFVRLAVGSGIVGMDSISGGVLFLVFAALWGFSGGRAMGFGDAKLVLGIGWFLPYPFNVFAAIYAFYAGAIYGLLFVIIPRALASRRRKSQSSFSSQIPFGPFLALGTVIAYFLPIQLW